MLMDENQQGFRSGRSTADASQTLLRIHEELHKRYKAFDKTGLPTTKTGEDPTAVLLDITKAYPRVNKPILWGI